MANPGNSNFVSLFELLEGMECEVQLALKAFLAKVKEESFGSDSGCDEQLRGQMIVERAIIALTRILMTLKDTEKLTPPQYGKDSVPSVSAPRITLPEVLERLESLEASITTSQQKQPDLEEKQGRLEELAGQDLEENLRLLREDVREVMKRCHQLENKQNSTCLKEELEIVKKECLSSQNFLAKKQFQMEKAGAVSEKRIAQLHQDVEQLKQNLLSFYEHGREIEKLNKWCKKIVDTQSEFVLKKDQDAVNTRILSTEDMRHARFDNSASDLKRQMIAVQKNVEREMEQMKLKLKTDLSKSGKRQLEEAVTTLENAIVERMQQEEILSEGVQDVNSRAQKLEEKMLAVAEKILSIEEEVKTSKEQMEYSKNQKITAHVAVQYAQMNSLIQSKMKNLEDLKRILNNIRDRSAFGAKIDALEKQVKGFSQRLGQSNYPSIAFSARLREEQVLKDNNIIKNLTHVMCNFGEALDTTSGIFTAPQDGLYVFGATLIKKLSTNGGMLVVQMLSSAGPSQKTLLYLQAKETELSCGGMVVKELRTSDKVYLKVTKVGDEMKLFQESCFCGWLVR